MQIRSPHLFLWRLNHEGDERTKPHLVKIHLFFIYSVMFFVFEGHFGIVSACLGGQRHVGHFLLIRYIRVIFG